MLATLVALLVPAIEGRADEGAEDVIEAKVIRAKRVIIEGESKQGRIEIWANERGDAHLEIRDGNDIVRLNLSELGLGVRNREGMNTCSLGAGQLTLSTPNGPYGEDNRSVFLRALKHGGSDLMMERGEGQSTGLRIQALPDRPTVVAVYNPDGSGAWWVPKPFWTWRLLFDAIVVTVLAGLLLAAVWKPRRAKSSRSN